MIQVKRANALPFKRYGVSLTIRRWRQDSMEVTEQDENAWRTSTFSNGTNCVEVAFTRRGVLVRDSKNHGAVLSLSHRVWRDFTTSIRDGHHTFDSDQT